jgi:formylglycine-generating enzyme
VVRASAFGLVLALAAGGATLAAGREAPPELPVLSNVVTSEGIVALRAEGPSAILIPAGRFIMGSDRNEIEVAVAMCRSEPLGDEKCDKRFENESEAHEVALSAYWIDRTEVTVAAYRRCVELGRCTAPPYASGAVRFDRPQFPVTLVTWQEADAYCHFAGGRLPTEAEWERAARGVDRRRFPWGNLYNRRLSNHGILAINPNDDTDGFGELGPVGSFPQGRTADGIDDMAGNVAEWTADAVDDVISARYAPATEINPKGPASGADRVVRGGGYNHPAALIRGAARDALPAGTRNPFLGFRCVRPAGEGL